MYSLREFFTTYYAPLRLRGRSQNTTRLYHCTIRSFERWLGVEPTLAHLDDLVVSRFLAYRAEKRSAFTAEKERTQLLSLARFAFDKKFLDTRPCVPPAPLPERIPSAWTIEQIRSLMQTCKAQPGTVGTLAASDFYSALVAVLWETAERIGAVMALRVADYAGGAIIVRAEYRKGKKRDKLYRLSPGTCSLLDRCVRGRRPDEHIFVWTKTHTVLWYAFGKIVEAAGLGKGRRAKFHQIRRSAATHYAAGGGDATALLDHSSPRITKAYLDPRFLNTGPAACDVLPPIT